jgi:hypothetical protein
VSVELRSGLEHHRVVPTLGIGQLHAVTHDERTGYWHG